MTLPRQTFARKIVRMRGYTREQAIVEVASVDGVSYEEAARRYDEASDQQVRRSVGQHKRHMNAKSAWDSARFLVFILADKTSGMACPNDLRQVSERAGWGTEFGFNSTGRAFREFVLPMVREGLLSEVRDEEDHLTGYLLTDAGQQAMKELL